jgi:hypothetical protein
MLCEQQVMMLLRVSDFARELAIAFTEGELDSKATCAKFSQVQQEGDGTVTREVGCGYAANAGAAILNRARPSHLVTAR